ncbi:hypothetical protein BAU16_05810 [Enterococcus sp. JM9B]|nr:hypothetical protein BAU16_05810 [Enterococcus sp. JM9B]
MFSYVLKLVFSFIVQSFFIRYLGVNYLGLNSLFNDIVSFLAVAELGLGLAIVYELYGPIARGDHEEITALMQLFKKIYHVIAGVVCLLGVALVPFLPLFSGQADQLFAQFYLIYFLFLLNSIVSYLFTYDRSLLIASQQNYLIVSIDTLMIAVMTGLQIFVLVTSQNYLLFLLIRIIGTVCANVMITLYSRKKYPQYKKRGTFKLSTVKKDNLKKITLGNLSSKIGGFVVTGTDNILISIFVGLTTVGIYANYLLIFTGIQILLRQTLAATTASIGHLGVTQEVKSIQQTFKRQQFINFTLLFFTVSLLAALINPFIRLWIGEQFLLSPVAVFLILVNYSTSVIRMTPLIFIDAFGLAWHQRWKALLESLLNIIFSLFLLIVFDLGITGILLGTLLSTVSTVLWFEPYIVHKFALKANLATYLQQMVKQFLILGGSSLLVVLVTNQLPEGGFGPFILRGVVTVILTMSMYLVLFYQTDGFKYSFSLLKKIKDSVFAS